MKPSKERLNLVDALVQLSFVVQSVLGRLAAERELSIIQVRLLGVLRGREPAMMELAAHLQLDKSSITGLVDRASRRGLVRRAPSEDDRRAVHVALTKRGRDLVEEFEAQLAREIAAITAPLGAAARARLIDLASQLIATQRA